MPSGKSPQPRLSSAERKAETTKRVSDEMTRTEAELREDKTRRLRAARLAMQESQPEPPKTKRPVRKAKPGGRSEA